MLELLAHSRWLQATGMHVVRPPELLQRQPLPAPPQARWRTSPTQDPSILINDTDLA
jgi:hypothetical protein